MHEMLFVRRATNRDVDAVQALVQGVLLEYGLRPDPIGTDADLSDIEAYYFRQGGLFEVLVNGMGTVFGSVGLYPLSPTTCELRKMYFAPEIRGQGWGKALLARTLRQADRLGFTAVTLETASVLREAIGLYRSFGFKAQTGRPHVQRCDQGYYLELAEFQAPPVRALDDLPT